MGVRGSRAVLCVAVLALAFSSAGHADWEGTLHITDYAGARKVSEHDARVYANGSRVRIDHEAELTKVGRTYTIYDFETRISYTVMPKLKMYVEENASDTGSDGQLEMPGGCAKQGTEDCLVSQGFSKAGVEVLDGRSCTRWERRRFTHGGRTHQMIWVLGGVTDVVTVKQIISSRVSRTMILREYKAASQPGSLFKVPDGFASITKAEALRTIGPVHRAKPE